MLHSGKPKYMHDQLRCVEGVDRFGRRVRIQLAVVKIREADPKSPRTDTDWCTPEVPGRIFSPMGEY